MARYVCTGCGYEGRRVVSMPGSRRTEIFLWVTLMFPGPFYTAWRLFSRKYSCPNCGRDAMVRSNSDAGILYLHEQERALFPTKEDESRRF